MGRCQLICDYWGIAAKTVLCMKGCSKRLETMLLFMCFSAFSLCTLGLIWMRLYMLGIKIH